jgi:nitrilase
MGASPDRQVFARLRQNSITVPGPEVAVLSEGAVDLKINVVMGVNERVEAGMGNGTLYNSLLMITAEAELANHHRKLVPTHTEPPDMGQWRRSWTEFGEDESRLSGD